MKVDLIAVLVAALIYYCLGILWYSQIFFKNFWSKLFGLQYKQVNKNGLHRHYLIVLISGYVLGYILAYVLAFTAVTTAWGGIMTGFWIWLGFIATTTLQSILRGNKPFKLYILNNIYYLLSLISMGAMLAVWR